MYTQNTIEKTIEFISLIPSDDKISKTTMINKTNYPAKVYCEYNCKLFNIPHLKDFVDVDSYIEGNLFRIQGYLTVKLGDFAEYSDEQLDLLIILAKEYTTWSWDEKKNLRMEIWNQRLTKE